VLETGKTLARARRSDLAGQQLQPPLLLAVEINVDRRKRRIGAKA
jgi:hypothetical protein